MDCPLLVNTRSKTLKSCKPLTRGPVFLETPSFLSEKYKITQVTVEKVITVIQRIIEACQIFGLCECPMTVSEYEEFLKFRAMSKAHKKNVQRLMFCFIQQVHKYLIFVSRRDEDCWVPLFKWRFAAFFSFYRGQEIPITPFEPSNSKERKLLSPFLLLGGLVHDWLGMLRVYDLDSFWEFVDTVLQLKKVMPVVSPYFIKKSIIKTVDSLTEERPQFCPTEEDIPLGSFLKAEWFNRASLVGELQGTVDEMFWFKKLTVETIEEPFFPSTSANYINSVMEGGALPALFGDQEAFGTYGTCAEGLIEESRLMIGVTTQELTQPQSWHYGDVGRFEEKVFKVQEDLDGSGPTERVPCLQVDDTDFRSKWKTFYWRVFEKARHEMPFVSPVGLAEPLKCRVITKGPPFLYTCLKPIQKFLWRVLKDHPCFTLIGRYVLESDITDLMNLAEEIIEDDSLYDDHLVGINDQFVSMCERFQFKALSGDYKASTDNLHSWCSHVIVDRLIDRLESNSEYNFWDGVNHYVGPPADLPKGFWSILRQHMHAALTGHIFDLSQLMSQLERDGLCEMDDEFRNIILVRTQKAGQLMGSIVSFPILCLANAALCRYALNLSVWDTHMCRWGEDKFKPFGEHATYSHLGYRRFLNERALGLDKLYDRPYEPFRFSFRLGKNSSYSRPPLLINGDDCLLIGGPKLKWIWELLGKVMGLESSMGKTYWSVEFCTINSTIFDLEYLDYTWKARERKYVNLGLVHGLQRSHVPQANEAWKGRQQLAGNLGNISRELQRSCPPAVWPRVKNLFIRHNMKALKKFSDNGLNWFLPEWLGGAGLPRDGEELSFQDVKGAALVRSKYVSQIRAPMKDIEWETHDIVMNTLCRLGLERTNYTSILVKKMIFESGFVSRLGWEDPPEFQVDCTLVNEVQNLEENWQKVYKLLTIDLLFTREWKSLFVEKSGKRKKPKDDVHIVHNGKIWKKIRKEICSSNLEPLTLAELDHQRKLFLHPTFLGEIRLSQPGPNNET